MSIRRIVPVLALAASAAAMACMDMAGPDVVTEVAALPEACAEWSCNDLVCGRPTAPPYHACCVRSIYDPPGSYSDPTPVAQEPVCSEGACMEADNECYWHNKFCHLNSNSQCGPACNPSDPCPSDPITASVCNSAISQSECIGRNL